MPQKGKAMVIDDLYYGNLQPAEDAGSHDPEYIKRNDRVLTALKDLEAALSEEQMVLLNQFHSRLNDLNCYETEAKFRYGLVLGIRLMQEVSADLHFHQK